ncbi:MAG: flagellar biosynthesis protein FlhF [Gemmatimonadetes bacterium]|nr:flagellar biosynthesis protein FlhF [Gemmatimonadota bacterium]
MKIRKFVAPSVPQALRQVRDDLGDQAVILNTRQIPGESGRQHVEITAALDAAPVANVASSASTAATAVAAAPARGDLLGRTYGRSAPGRQELSAEPRWEESASPSPAMSRGQGSTLSGVGHTSRNLPLLSDRLATRRPQDGQSAGAAAWLASLPAVSDRLGTDSEPRPAAVEGPLANQDVSDDPIVDRPVADTNQQSAPVLRRLRQIEDAVRHMSRHSSSFDLPPEVARLGERLRRVGVYEDVTRALLPKVLRRVPEEDLDNREAVVTAAAQLLYEQLPARADLRIGREQKVVAFVGPSGSGKTTAIAKIAAGFVRRRSRRPDYKEGEIVIVSTDTQRVGALAQARAYADLIGVPLEDAHDAQDLARILAHHDKARLILIDTAGIGPHEVKQREQ